MRGPADLRAIGTLVGAPHRVLGALTRPSLAPVLSGRLSTPSPLAALVGALRGRVVVTNPCATGRLPDAVGTLARAVLRPTWSPDPPPAVEAPAFSPTSAPTPARMDARDAADARRRAALLDALPDTTRPAFTSGAHAWAAAALYEPTTLDVRFVDTPHMPPAAPAPRPMAAAVRYRLALVVGAGDGLTWADVDTAVAAAPAVAWPVGALVPMPWFTVRLLVADTDVAHGMDPGTLARWAAVTGRAGPASRDSYWYAETWDRFREPSRRVGHVTPAYVACSRRAAPPPSPPSLDALSFDTAGGLALTPDAERGICVPPGYGLVDCVGTLEIAVIGLTA
ncbi:MAG: hypothetical protein JO180_01245 [Gemmatirosa sp.]|nr:hypothetical protein [Gemmatirosa sp.]